jgi:hypothetical protein
MFQKKKEGTYQYVFKNKKYEKRKKRKSVWKISIEKVEKIK